MLKGFRERAGQPAPGEGLKGWSRETTEATFGQWVSGLARLSRVLGDRTLADKAVDLVEGYAATLPASGATGMGIYGWEKLVCGLVDLAAYAGYDAGLTLLSKIVQAETFDETRRVPTGNDFGGQGRPSRRSGTRCRRTCTRASWPAGTRSWPSTPGAGTTTPTGITS